MATGDDETCWKSKREKIDFKLMWIYFCCAKSSLATILHSVLKTLCVRWAFQLCYGWKRESNCTTSREIIRYVHYPSEMAKITLQSPTTSGFEAPCLPILTAGTPTCELCLHRKVWCGRWRWLSSHSWHSWWRLFRPVRPRARWGWSGRRRWATWRHTLHRAPGDIGLLRGGGVRANMNRSKERWDFLSPSVISHQMAAWLYFF